MIKKNGTFNRFSIKHISKRLFYLYKIDQCKHRIQISPRNKSSLRPMKERAIMIIYSMRKRKKKEIKERRKERKKEKKRLKILNYNK